MIDHTASHPYGAQRLRQTAERIAEAFVRWHLDEREPREALKETVTTVTARFSRASGPLLHALRHDGDSSVQSSAAEALGEAADHPDVRYALTHALRHDDDSSVRWHAAGALSQAAAAKFGRSPQRVRLPDLRLGAEGPRFPYLLAACRTSEETSHLLAPLHAAGARLMRGRYLRAPSVPQRATLPALWRRVRWRLTARTPHFIRVGVTHITSTAWLARLPSPTDGNSPLAAS